MALDVNCQFVLILLHIGTFLYFATVIVTFVVDTFGLLSPLVSWNIKVGCKRLMEVNHTSLMKILKVYRTVDSFIEKRMF